MADQDEGAGPSSSISMPAGSFDMQELSSLLDGVASMPEGVDKAAAIAAIVDDVNATKHSGESLQPGFKLVARETIFFAGTDQEKTVVEMIQVYDPDLAPQADAEPAPQPAPVPKKAPEPQPTIVEAPTAADVHIGE